MVRRLLLNCQPGCHVVCQVLSQAGDNTTMCCYYAAAIGTQGAEAAEFVRFPDSNGTRPAPSTSGHGAKAEGVGGGNEGDAVVPATPGADFEVGQAQGLFHLAVAVLDAPAEVPP
ncbi:hypothetical protein [Streptomyces sp. NPDC005181]|uniref:hypothetical protein n=1 Tax=Streptomyces sp. NPDC005181 TaxID=3156869 RepID=UPI0033AA3FF7